MKKDCLAGVVALGEENPKRFAKVIRNGWPEIKAAMDQGHTLKVIHQRLAERGVRISYRHFTRSVRHLLATPRTARDESEKVEPKITAPVRTEKRNDSGHDEVVMEIAAPESRGNPDAPVTRHIISPSRNVPASRFDRRTLDSLRTSRIGF